MSSTICILKKKKKDILFVWKHFDKQQVSLTTPLKCSNEFLMSLVV